MKKFAYLILIAAVGVSGYFFYDTYVTLTGDKDSNDTKTEEESKSSMNIKYNEYNLDVKYKYALSVVSEKKTMIYFYDKSVDCNTADAFEASNVDLGLVLSISKDAAGVDASKISTSSMYIRKADGKYLEITGVPGVKNSITITKDAANSKLTGSTDLAWDNRTVKGDYESKVCTVAAK